MTPQEQDLVNELLDRLAKLESNPRDPDAERLIADGLRRAPHAVYALVQTALVQDEALKLANARIEELQAQVGGQEQPRGGSFLIICAMPSSVGASREAPCHRPRPIDHSQDIPRRRRPIPRVPVWHRAWARPLVRAGRFWVRPPRRQQA